MSDDETNFRPLRALMLVRRDKPDSELGGIVVPEAWRTYGWRATILRRGPDVACDFHDGDTILFLKDTTVLPFKDRTLAVTDSKSVIARLVVIHGIERILPLNRYVVVSPYTLGPPAGIAMTERHEAQVCQGIVHSAADDCHDVKLYGGVWYPAKSAIKAYESTYSYDIVREDDILMFSEMQKIS